MPLGMKLGPGHIVLDGDPTPLIPQKIKSHSPAIFSPCLLWSPISATGEHLYTMLPRPVESYFIAADDGWTYAMYAYIDIGPDPFVKVLQRQTSWQTKDLARPARPLVCQGVCLGRPSLDYVTTSRPPHVTGASLTLSTVT